MAQTKKRKRRKRRGTQAGTVDVNRASRSKPRNREEARARSREKRMQRFERPPTLKGSSVRAGVAAVIFFVVVFYLERRIASSIALGVMAFAIYLPISYWTDRFVYKRHQRKKAQGEKSSE